MASSHLIEQGKPLPDKYRFILFEDKREVELVWNGKTREVCIAVPFFQTLEHTDEPQKESGTDIPACDPANTDKNVCATLQPELLHARSGVSPSNVTHTWDHKVRLTDDSGSGRQVVSP